MEQKTRFFPRLLLISILVLAVPVGVYLVNQSAIFFTRAGGVQSELVIDAGSTFTIPTDTWQSIAQGGEEQGRSMAVVVEKGKALTPEYIRIDHIYDFYDVVSRSGNQLNFNWSQLDEVVRQIQAMGAKPFLSLSYMPKALSRGDTTDLPTNWNDWEIVVQRTIEHYSGSMKIKDVYYEVWNEPDLFGNFKIYGEKNYLELYRHSVNGAQRAQNVETYKIGGPATTALYKNWFFEFFKFAEASNLRVDFYSWHRYSTSLEEYEKDLTNAQVWLTEIFTKYQNVELIISELGPNSAVDPVNDSHLGGIHALATSAMFDGKVSHAFTFELKDGPGPSKLWGRWGILTHEKYGAPEEKPRYQALRFLNRMTGNKANLIGEGTWVKAFARRQDSTLRVLVANFDPEGKHNEAVPLTFVNLPSQNFSFKRIDYLGGEREQPVSTSSATWARYEYMRPNSAAIFELKF